MPIGWQVLSADGAIGVSGSPVKLWGFNFVSGASAGTVIFRNGTSASGTEVFRQTGTANAATTAMPGGDGIVFPSGLFVDIDANVTQATAFYEKF